MIVIDGKPKNIQNSFNSLKHNILSMHFFPFGLFPAALDFAVTQFDIYFFAFQAVGYHFRADQFEIYN